MAPRKRTHGETSSSRGPRVDTMGLRQLTNAQKEIWAKLTKPGRTIQETKFLDPTTLHTLGLRTPVRKLMAKVGLEEFVVRQALTFERPTLEFLSTLERGSGENGKFIRFNLHDIPYTMTYPEVMEAFDWQFRADDDFLTPGGFNPATFYSRITNGLAWHARVKSSSLPHPALRLLHRFLSMTIFCHGEPTNLPRFDLQCLWAMTPEGVGCPNWVEVFVENCLDLGRKDKGKISMGGMVTLLADYLEAPNPVDAEGNPLLVPLGTREDRYTGTQASNVYNIDQLRRASMLWVGPRRDHYVWLYGANSVKYITLPQPDRTAIPDNASHDILFVPPDPQYQAGVEEELGRGIGEPPEDEPEDQGNYRRGQGRRIDRAPEPQPQPQTGYDMLLAQMQSMDRRIEQRMDGFDDRLYSMSTMVTAMNSFYVSQFPTYPDPTPQIEETLRQRQAERDMRGARHHEPGGTSGS